jgi:hypothetical protein
VRRGERNAKLEFLKSVIIAAQSTTHIDNGRAQCVALIKAWSTAASPPSKNHRR